MKHISFKVRRINALTGNTEEELRALCTNKTAPTEHLISRTAAKGRSKDELCRTCWARSS